jgi:indolepyruvate ferredoxin oxidoreductase alpha subunit
MGASITMAKGAADAGVRLPSQLLAIQHYPQCNSLLDCVYENTPVTIIISDNATTAMTGGQASHATGKLEEICVGLGVKSEHVKVLTPLPKFNEEMVKVFREEFMYEGVSVIIPRRECIVQSVAKNKKEGKVRTGEVKL